jgi:hypothetical protein
MADQYFRTPAFAEDLKKKILCLELVKEARYWEQGCREEDGEGFDPHHVVWNVLPDNWKGEQPVCPFFVATCPDYTVPRLLLSIRHGQVTVWDVEGFTKQ